MKALLLILAFAAQDGKDLERVRDLEKGYRAYHEGRYAAAEKAFRKFLKVFPDDADARAALGRTLIERGREREGKEHLKAAIEKQEDPAELKRLGADLAKEEKHELAVSAQKKAALLDKSPESYTALGQSLLNLRDGDAALAALNEAKALAPESLQTLKPYLQEAEAYRAAQAGDFDKIDELSSTVTDPGLQKLLQVLSRRMHLAFEDTHIQVGTSPIFDSNAIVLDDNPLLGNDIFRESSAGWSANARIEQRIVKFAGRQLSAVLDAVERVYFDTDIPDTTDVSLAFEFDPYTEPVPPASSDLWEWYAAYRFDSTFVDYDTFLLSHELSFTVARIWSQRQQTSLRYSAGLDDFVDEPVRSNDDRDGVTHHLELTHAMLIVEDPNIQFRIGIYGRTELRQGSNFDVDMYGGRVGVSGPLVWEITWDVTAHYRREDYVRPNTELNLTDEREDDLFEVTVNLRRPITENVTVWVRYTGTDRDSNISQFDYSRNFFGMGVDWEF